MANSRSSHLYKDRNYAVVFLLAGLSCWYLAFILATVVAAVLKSVCPRLIRLRTFITSENVC
jgi:hypothetical protein